LSKKFSRRGILFVVSAPSGAGKTTLVERNSANPNLFILSRAQPGRRGPVNRRPGLSISFRCDFRERVEKGDFLEHAQVHGDHYGTLRGTGRDESKKLERTF
jgi:guanylate kinase